MDLEVRECSWEGISFIWVGTFSTWLTDVLLLRQQAACVIRADWRRGARHKDVRGELPGRKNSRCRGPAVGMRRPLWLEHCSSSAEWRGIWLDRCIGTRWSEICGLFYFKFLGNCCRVLFPTSWSFEKVDLAVICRIDCRVAREETEGPIGGRQRLQAGYGVCQTRSVVAVEMENCGWFRLFLCR